MRITIPSENFGGSPRFSTQRKALLLFEELRFLSNNLEHHRKEPDASFCFAS
jgi:hypothetical protein